MVSIGFVVFLVIVATAKVFFKQDNSEITKFQVYISPAFEVNLFMLTLIRLDVAHEGFNTTARGITIEAIQ